MYHIKNDQRSIRSAETIYTALVTLMETNPFQAIKVSELVAQAEVGRATFYRNFDLLEDVLQWRCDQVVDDFFIYLAEYRRANQLTLPFPFLKPLLRFFYLHSDIVELLIKANRVDMLQTAIEERLKLLSQHFGPIINLPTQYREYARVIRSSMIVTILVLWIKEGKKEAPDVLADGIVDMSEKMIAFNALL